MALTDLHDDGRPACDLYIDGLETRWPPPPTRTRTDLDTNAVTHRDTVPKRADASPRPHSLHPLECVASPNSASASARASIQTPCFRCTGSSMKRTSTKARRPRSRGADALRWAARIHRHIMETQDSDTSFVKDLLLLLSSVHDARSRLPSCTRPPCTRVLALPLQAPSGHLFPFSKSTLKPTLAGHSRRCARRRGPHIPLPTQLRLQLRLGLRLLRPTALRLSTAPSPSYPYPYPYPTACSLRTPLTAKHCTRPAMPRFVLSFSLLFLARLECLERVRVSAPAPYPICITSICPIGAVRILVPFDADARTFLFFFLSILTLRHFAHTRGGPVAVPFLSPLLYYCSGSGRRLRLIRSLRCDACLVAHTYRHTPALRLTPAQRPATGSHAPSYLSYMHSGLTGLLLLPVDTGAVLDAARRVQLLSSPQTCRTRSRRLSNLISIPHRGCVCLAHQSSISHISNTSVCFALVLESAFGLDRIRVRSRTHTLCSRTHHIHALHGIGIARACCSVVLSAVASGWMVGWMLLEYVRGRGCALPRALSFSRVCRIHEYSRYTSRRAPLQHCTLLPTWQ
ncbi:hypothetical protein C8R45DRAFT_603286 [Mycena sanguinolenta]|nr:hypothetical protein C8R45DRAFT_603286 [Mycena sanguinolenta]